MSETLYKWLNGREATHVPDFRYRLRVWTPRIESPLVACVSGYHLCRERDLLEWIASDLFISEYEGELIESTNKVIASRVRIVEHLKGWDQRTARLFASDCAEQILTNFEDKFPNDDRPRLAIQAARDFANGLISQSAESAAEWAARSAAWSAAGSAAELAARSAASAELAARSAELAELAAKKWQTARLLDYAYGRI